MDTHKDISYNISDEFSKIYIFGPARSLEKVMIGIANTLGRNYDKNRFEGLFGYIEDYEVGRISKKDLKQLFLANRVTTFEFHRVSIVNDLTGRITGNQDTIVLQYGCNGHDEYFKEVKDVFRTVLEKYV